MPVTAEELRASYQSVRDRCARFAPEVIQCKPPSEGGNCWGGRHTLAVYNLPPTPENALCFLFQKHWFIHQKVVLWRLLENPPQSGWTTFQAFQWMDAGLTAVDHLVRATNIGASILWRIIPEVTFPLDQVPFERRGNALYRRREAMRRRVPESMPTGWWIAHPAFMGGGFNSYDQEEEAPYLDGPGPWWEDRATGRHVNWYLPYTGSNLRRFWLNPPVPARWIEEVTRWFESVRPEQIHPHRGRFVPGLHGAIADTRAWIEWGIGLDFASFIKRGVEAWMWDSYIGTESELRERQAERPRLPITNQQRAQVSEAIFDYAVGQFTSLVEDFAKATVIAATGGTGVVAVGLAVAAEEATEEETPTERAPGETAVDWTAAGVGTLATSTKFAQFLETIGNIVARVTADWGGPRIQDFHEVQPPFRRTFRAYEYNTDIRRGTFASTVLAKVVPALVNLEILMEVRFADKIRVILEMPSFGAQERIMQAVAYMSPGALVMAKQQEDESKRKKAALQKTLGGVLAGAAGVAIGAGTAWLLKRRRR